MAGIRNTTARQFNLKCRTKDKAKSLVVVRLAPGFSVVKDEHWKHLKEDPYVMELEKKGFIEFGRSLDELAKTKKPDTVTKSKLVKNKTVPRAKKDLEDF